MLKPFAVAALYMLGLSAVALTSLAFIQAQQKPGLEAARIVQLEQQLQQLYAQQQVCEAKLLTLQQPQMLEQQRKQREETEKALGCALDWSATPPVCKDSKP